MDVRVVAQDRGVLTAVVGAEEEFAAAVEARAHVGLGATPVAAIGGGQARCQCSVRIGLLIRLFSWIRVDPVSGGVCWPRRPANSQTRKTLPGPKVSVS